MSQYDPSRVTTVEEASPSEANSNDSIGHPEPVSSRSDLMELATFDTDIRPDSRWQESPYQQGDSFVQSNRAGPLVPYDHSLRQRPPLPISERPRNTILPEGHTALGQPLRSRPPLPQTQSTPAPVTHDNSVAGGGAGQPEPNRKAQIRTNDQAASSHTVPPNWPQRHVNPGPYHYYPHYSGFPAQCYPPYYLPYGFSGQGPSPSPRGYSDLPPRDRFVSSAISDDQASSSHPSNLSLVKDEMETKNIDAVHNPSQADKDITIKLELPIEENWGPEVEELCRLGRLGRFKDAHELYQTKLEHLSTKVPYVSIQYLDILWESGDFGSYPDYDPHKTNFLSHAKPWLKAQGQDKNRAILETNSYLLLVESAKLRHPPVNEVLEILGELSGWGLAGSTEVQILCLSLKILRWLADGDSDAVISAVRRMFDLNALYPTLCSQNRIWDFRDLFYRLVRLAGFDEASEWFFGTADLPDVLDKIYADWTNTQYDESVALGLLDLYTSIILDDGEPTNTFSDFVVPRPQNQVPLLLEHAKAQAESIQRQSPEYMKSRPFIQWLLAKYVAGMGAAPRRPDGGSLRDAPGLILEEICGVNLPVFVPVDPANRPGWDLFYVRSDPAGRYAVEVSLQTANELGDYRLQEMALKLLILQSPNPKQMMDALATMQRSILGYSRTLIQTYLCKYLISSGEDIEELLQNLTQYSAVADPEYSWACSVLKGFLAAAEGDRAQSSMRDPLAFCKEEVKRNGSRLPEYIKNFTQEQLGIRVQSAHRQHRSAPRQSSTPPLPQQQKKLRRQKPVARSTNKQKRPWESRASRHAPKLFVPTTPGASFDNERLRHRFDRLNLGGSPQPEYIHPSVHLPQHISQLPPAQKSVVPSRSSSGDWKVEGWSDTWREDAEYHNLMHYEKVAGWPSTWREDLARMYGYGDQLGNDVGPVDDQHYDQEEEPGATEHNGQYADRDEDEHEGEDEQTGDEMGRGDDYSDGEDGTEEESQDSESDEELNGSSLGNSDIAPDVKVSRGLPKLDFPQTLLEEHTMTVIVQNRNDPSQSKTYFIEKSGVVERSASGSETSTNPFPSHVPSIPSEHTGDSRHESPSRPGKTGKRKDQTGGTSLGDGLTGGLLKGKSRAEVTRNSPTTSRDGGKQKDDEDWELEDKWKGADEVIFQGRRRGGAYAASTGGTSQGRVSPMPVGTE